MGMEGLRNYLSVLSREGYASTDGGKNADGSRTITHARGAWRTLDTYFGGEPYGGDEVVFYQDRPVWMMVYYGAVDPAVADVGGIYGFLKSALSHTDESFPLRGPRAFASDGLSYENEWQGGLERFSGIERIRASGREVYSATYAGGVIDRRTE